MGAAASPMLPVALMGQVSVTLNGRTYTLRCADGEEAYLIALATYVKNRAEAVAQEFRPVSDDRALLITAILIADELSQARAKAAVQGDGHAAVPQGNNRDVHPAPVELPTRFQK